MPVRPTISVSAAMSPAVRMEPVGLCGELIISSRVRGVIASRTASQSIR